MKWMRWWYCPNCEYHWEDYEPVYHCPACKSEDIASEEEI